MIRSQESRQHAGCGRTVVVCDDCGIECTEAESGVDTGTHIGWYGSMAMATAKGLGWSERFDLYKGRARLRRDVCPACVSKAVAHA